MKTIFIFFLILFTLASCVHEETIPVEMSGTVKGIHIHATEFLKLSKEDIRKMSLATEFSNPQKLKLSENQKANCKNHKCEFDGKNVTGTFESADIKIFFNTLTKSQQSKREEKFTDGPVTIRCLPSHCVADFNLDYNQPHNFSTKATAKVKTDYTSFLLGSFIAGIAK